MLPDGDSTIYHSENSPYNNVFGDPELNFGPSANFRIQVDYGSIPSNSFSRVLVVGSVRAITYFGPPCTFRMTAFSTTSSNSSISSSCDIIIDVGAKLAANSFVQAIVVPLGPIPTLTLPAGGIFEGPGTFNLKNFTLLKIVPAPTFLPVLAIASSTPAEVILHDLPRNIIIDWNKTETVPKFPPTFYPLFLTDSTTVSALSNLYYYDKTDKYWFDAVTLPLSPLGWQILQTEFLS